MASLASCSLDYEPISTPTELTQGTTTDTKTAALKDRAAAVSQRTALYNLLKNRQEHWHLDLLLIGDSHADNSYAGTTGAEVVPFENNNIDASNSVLNRDWNRYLDDIAKANVLIIGLDQLKADNAVSDAEYRQWRAEGLIFRSLIMFNMARIWGGFPLKTTLARTITADNIKEVYGDYFPGRNSVEECYQQIINDLTEAEKYAPDFNTTDRTLMTKTTAQALLAKVYAEKPVQNYQKVVEYAQKVRNTAGLTLEPSFETLWGYDSAKKDVTKRNTSESILEVQYLQGAANWESWMFGRNLANWDESFTWAKWITPSRDLIADFTKEGDNVRLNQSVVYYECSWSNYYPSNHYPFMYKYRSNFNNRYLLRLADIILMEAEAQAYLGKLSESAALVNMIRNRVKLPNLTSAQTSSKEAMINAVLHERRLELAFEGERWFDLCRNNKVEAVMNSVYARDAGRLTQRRTFNANSYLLPVPQPAIDQNSNLKQNPGY